MYYAYNTFDTPASWVRFPTETERDDFASRKPDTRRPCDPPADTSGFRAFFSNGLRGETRQAAPGELP